MDGVAGVGGVLSGFVGLVFAIVSVYLSREYAKSEALVMVGEASRMIGWLFVSSQLLHSFEANDYSRQDFRSLAGVHGCKEALAPIRRS